MNKDIKFLVMDADGTLTDGKIYMGKSDELFKAFNIKDGCGIKDILPIYRIIPVVITGRESKILEARCEELGIHELHQGIRCKENKLEELIADYSHKHKAEYSYQNCAYIGDDILDIQCMKLIKSMKGFVGCPSDAITEIRNIADFISSKNGGDGAVREFIEWLVNV